VVDDLGVKNSNSQGWILQRADAFPATVIFAYQSECADQRAHERHWVEVPLVQAGGAHSSRIECVPCPQLQDQRSSFWGDQPQSGAADARIKRTEALLFLKLAIQNNGRRSNVVREGARPGVKA
jgi:hypothetical protein